MKPELIVVCKTGILGTLESFPKETRSGLYFKSDALCAVNHKYVCMKGISSRNARFRYMVSN